MKELSEEDLKIISEEEFANKIKLTKINLNNYSAKNSNNNIKSQSNINIANLKNQRVTFLNKRSVTPQRKDIKKSNDFYSSNNKGIINISQSNSNVNKFSGARALASSVNKNIVKKRIHISDKNLINPITNGINLNIGVKKKR